MFFSWINSVWCSVTCSVIRGAVFDRSDKENSCLGRQIRWIYRSVFIWKANRQASAWMLRGTNSSWGLSPPSTQTPMAPQRAMAPLPVAAKRVKISCLFFTPRRLSSRRLSEIFEAVRLSNRSTKLMFWQFWIAFWSTFSLLWNTEQRSLRSRRITGASEEFIINDSCSNRINKLVQYTTLERSIVSSIWNTKSNSLWKRARQFTNIQCVKHVTYFCI